MEFVDREAFTFDDVLLVPRYNEVVSRRDVNLDTRLTRNISIPAPLVSANMDTVTGPEMILAMHKLGCTGILHRFLDYVATREALEVLRGSSVYPLCASLGINGEALDRLAILLHYEVHVVCIDVAHGHSKKVIDMVRHIKTLDSNIDVIAGNVATQEGTRALIEAGADAVKVGIGPGSMCTTRLVTGNGVPQLSAIMECVDVAGDIPIIADGGLRTSGDVAKALAAGASTVMSGSFFAGTKEAPGDIIEKGDKKYKSYRGMASKDAMIGWKGKGYHAAPEGEATVTPYKGTVKEVVKPILAGVRSSMTYQGARNLREFRERAIFRRVSPNCLIENKPHGK